MTNINALIVGHGIQRNKETGATLKVYKVIGFNFVNNKIINIVRKAVPENTLKQIIASKKLIFGNVELCKDGTLRGSTGSLDRFASKGTLVIISEIKDSKGSLLGYKIANGEGQVTNKKVAEVLKYCENMKSKGITPIQNGQYIEENDKKPYIRAFVEGSYPVEILERKSNTHAKVKESKVIEEENKKNIDVKDIFSKEQLVELRKGKSKGINYRIYCNPKFTAEQMKVLRETLELNLPAHKFANPKYDVGVMKLLKADLSYGIDIDDFLNPAYNMEQIAELENGLISGVDISVYADPKNNANEMAEIRIRLENNIWRELEVKDED